MKTVIIYYTKTGFTKKYANWLAEALECKAIPLHEAKPEDMNDADTVVFASWIHAGMIKKLSWFKSQQLDGRHKVVLATGASPGNVPDTLIALENNFKNDDGAYKAFYVQSGIAYEKMSFGNRMLMKAFSAMVQKKKDKNEMEQGMADAISHSFDASKEEYLIPVIEYVKSL